MAEVVRRLTSVSSQAVAESALRGGYPITCATCERLKLAFEESSEDCGKMITCGGPIFGRDYPDYKGPLKPSEFENLCLKCGSHIVDYHTYGGVRRFGLCSLHKGIFDKVDGPGTQRPLVLRAPSISL